MSFSNSSVGRALVGKRYTHTEAILYGNKRKKYVPTISREERINRAYMSGFKCGLFPKKFRSQPVYRYDDLNQAWLKGNLAGRQLKASSSVDFHELLLKEQEILKTNTRSN